MDSHSRHQTTFKSWLPKCSNSFFHKMMDPPNVLSSKNLVHWELLREPTVIQRCQQQLKTEGLMVLEDFATSDGLHALHQEILNAPFNEVLERTHTPWQDQGDPTYPTDHPRNFRLTSSVAFVGRKSLEQTTQQLGISIYNNDALIEFCTKVAQTQLFRSQDENGSVYSYRIHPSHKPEWHFDESHFTAILYLENSGDGGGEFCWVPWCRPTKSKDDEIGHEMVRKVLMEKDFSSVRKVPAIPGTLVFFSGAHSFHKAARVEKHTNNSNAKRLGIVFTFFEQDGHSNSDNVKDINNWDPSDHAI
jgi:hypothetical protein